MRDLGLGALAHANRHAAYAAIDNPSWPELSVLQAAHVAELLIKARIAQEHPLLIFEQLPRSTQALGADLNLEDLFSLGRTVQWADLPERLWAATGISIQREFVSTVSDGSEMGFSISGRRLVATQATKPYASSLKSWTRLLTNVGDCSL